MRRCILDGTDGSMGLVETSYRSDGGERGGIRREWVGVGLKVECCAHGLMRLGTWVVKTLRESAELR